MRVVSDVTNVLPLAQAPAQVTNLQAAQQQAQQATAIGVGVSAADPEEDFSDLPF